MQNQHTPSSAHGQYDPEALAARIRAELKGHCPAHEDKNASFSVSVVGGKLLYHCFANCSQEQVRAALIAKGLLPAQMPKQSNPKIASKRHLQAEEDEAAIYRARKLWDRSKPTKGTVVETYLRKHRKITLPIPEDIRFLPYVRPTWGAPAMLVAIRDDEGEVVAVQETYLDPNTGAKLGCTPDRRIYGRCGNGAAKLAMPSDSDEMLAIAEGTETALSVMQMKSMGVPCCWAACGAKRIKDIAIPKNVLLVRLYVDHDATGEEHGNIAAHAFLKRGLHVEMFRPPKPGTDFNDVLRAQVRK